MANTKDLVRLESSKLNINDIIQSVVSPNCGAVSTFIGTTRDNFEDKKVVKLEYEAYEPMAIKEMQGVCSKVRSQWNVEKIAIFHRLGEVPTMEASIVIAISSPHRLESLKAVQFTIDAVKTSVPIWKKEIYENEEPQWKQNKECFWARSVLKPKVEEIREINEKAPNLQFNTTNTELEDVDIDLDNVYETVEVSTEIANIDNDYESDNSTDNVKIDPDQIQIKADAEELNRRIASFISRKREHVDMLNIQQFCANSFQKKDDSDDETCVCARVNAVVMRYKDSVSHVKVHRVYNQWSQQKTKPKETKQNTESNNYPSALEERLSATEKILGINKPVSRDIYERLKKVEDRLLVLESISPEYKDLWAIDDCSSEKSYDKFDDTMDSQLNSKPMRKRTYPSTELNSKLNELEFRYGKRAK